MEVAPSLRHKASAGRLKKAPIDHGPKTKPRLIRVYRGRGTPGGFLVVPDTHEAGTGTMEEDDRGSGKHSTEAGSTPLRG